MGNQASCTSGGTGTHRSGNPFRKNTGRLGLSREELDIRCKPSGLYESCSWDHKTIRKLIGDGKLASRLEGTDDRKTSSDQECPICFLHYSSINMLNCCKATICSECYLQVQNKGGGNPCPFCNKAKMTVKVAKCLDDEGIMKRDEDEQKIIEARIRAKYGSGIASASASANNGTANNGGDDNDVDGNNKNNNSESALTPGNAPSSANNNLSSSFGSNLDADVRNRTRSRTLSSSTGKDQDVIVAMSPDERRALEEEMRSQRNHPLMQQMTQDADRERLRHELEHRQLSSDRRRSSQRRLEQLLNRRASDIRGNRERREFNQRLSVITGIHDDSDEEQEASERLDDLFMIEAALYLSMRDREGRPARSSSNGIGINSLAGAGAGAGGNGNGNGTNSGDGSSLSGSGRSGRTGSRSRSRASRDRNRSRHAVDPQNLIQALLRERGEMGERTPFFDGDGHGHNNYSDRDALFMDMSEASQLEMAIQLSLQESQQREEQEQTQQQQDQQDQVPEPEPEPDSTNYNNDQSLDAGINEIDHGMEEIVFESIDEPEPLPVPAGPVEESVENVEAERITGNNDAPPPQTAAAD